MGHNIAAVRGTTSLYAYLDGNKVLVMRDGYQYKVVSVEAFDDLYYTLSLEYAALKEDCIEYAVHYPDKPLYEYPQWYINAYTVALIYDDGYGGYLMYDEACEIPMAPGSIVLKNKFGDIRYMERNEFDRYYEIVGGLDNES